MVRTLVLVLALVCAGCGSSTVHTPIASIPPTATSVDPLAGSKAVGFVSPDGVTLEGRLFGEGAVGVVLVHYADPSLGQTMWFPFAQVLREHGYRVLTFNFRGYCPGGTGGCSGGTFVKTESWRDVVLASDFLRSQSVQRVFVMGAGLGGHSSLWAASQSGVHFSGVVSVSTPQLAIGGPSSYDLTPVVLRRILEPKLFIAGAEPGAEATTDAQSMYGISLQPKQLALLPSAGSGPDLFAVGSAHDVQAATQLILDFLARNS